MAIDPKDLNPGDKIWYLRKVKPNNRMEAIVKKKWKNKYKNSRYLLSRIWSRRIRHLVLS